MLIKEAARMIPLPANDKIPAAQYLRMSRTWQQFSVDNQSDTNQAYAEVNGFRIVKTYADLGESGLFLAHRSGLQQLLQDVLRGKCDYRAVLVYDISRFGRFQDPDEAAHYEFLCKMAGVPIHYCAEFFDEMFGVEKSVLKAIKRVMAAEFSRDMSATVTETKIRAVERGFWVGGKAGYGLRRLVRSQGTAEAQILKRGEWKGLHGERVVLTPGPAQEVACVRNMFQMAIEGMTATEITRKVNQGGTTFYGSLWKRDTVASILGNSKYAGDNIWGRNTEKLGSRRTAVPEAAWIMKRDAFEPVIDRALFDRAQAKLLERAHHRTKEQLLADLRKLLNRKGHLARALIDQAYDLACERTYRYRFGSLRAAYDLIGYRPTTALRVAHRSQMRRLKYKLLQSIADLYPGQTTFPRNRHFRPILVFDNAVSVSLLFARCSNSSGLRWLVEPIAAESKLITLLCFWNATHTDFAYFWVLPNIGRSAPFRLSHCDQWLQRGRQLSHLGDLRGLVMDFAQRETPAAKEH